MEISKFNVYSIGIVAANKLLSSKDIEVMPVEDLPMLNGELTDNAIDFKMAVGTESGTPYMVDIKSTGTVRATWLPMGLSNRMTAPDVRRGERVILYRYADTDQFWWATLRDDMHLRKLETVIYAFSDTSVESDTPNADNTYFLEISTHRKVVHFHTAKSDGEPFKYDIQIDTKNGGIVIMDDAGNSVSLNSRERQILLMNGDQSYVNIDKQVIDINSKDKVNIVTKDFNVNADNTNLTSNRNTITSTTTHNGRVTINGNLQVSGGSGRFDSTISVNGLIQGGSGQFSGNVIAPNIR